MARSAAAQKARPLPVRTSATRSSAAARLTASRSSCTATASRGLSFSGRTMRTHRAPPAARRRRPQYGRSSRPKISLAITAFWIWAVPSPIWRDMMSSIRCTREDSVV